MLNIVLESSVLPEYHPKMLPKRDKGVALKIIWHAFKHNAIANETEIGPISCGCLALMRLNATGLECRRSRIQPCDAYSTHSQSKARCLDLENERNRKGTTEATFKLKQIS